MVIPYAAMIAYCRAQEAIARSRARLARRAGVSTAADDERATMYAAIADALHEAGIPVVPVA